MNEAQTQEPPRTPAERATRFRALHAPGSLLVLPNAWDAGSARVIESCGATAIATTSSGVAWSQGYPDGNKLPPAVLARAVASIARVLTVPLSVDSEAGYSSDPRQVGETIAAIVAAGAVGVNLEDGSDAPDLLAAKIEAAKSAAARSGVDLFVNARTDVVLRGLVPAERVVGEIIERARRYREAGCDGIFVPALADRKAIADLVGALDLPLNLMIVPGLPPVAELRALGVRRVSAGAALAMVALGAAQRAATQLVAEGRYDLSMEGGQAYGRMQSLLAPALAGTR